MALLADVEQGIRRIAERVGPSVVGIGQRWGVGSGVVIADSRVLTNAHNVRGDRTTVTFHDPAPPPASVSRTEARTSWRGLAMPNEIAAG